MNKFISFALSVLLLALVLSGCGSNSNEDEDHLTDNLAGEETTSEKVTSADALTILICGPSSNDLDSVADYFKEKNETDVNIVKYAEDGDEWDKFLTKVMAQDSDFDLFVPIGAQLGDIVRSGVYDDLNGYESIKTRIESNGLVNSVSEFDDKKIGLPYLIQPFYSGDSEYAMTWFKYCYKNLNLYTNEYIDSEGDELFKALKHHYDDPSESRENAFYDFDYYAAETSYVFLNKNSEKKDTAIEFLCLLFDIENGNIEADNVLPFTYPKVEEGVEYTPYWLFYTYDYVDAIANAFQSAEETDGSDDALNKLAEEAAKTVRMRMNG